MEAGEAKRKSKKLTIILLISYLSVLVALVILSRFSLRLSYLIPLIFPFALIEGRPLKFLYEWSPFYFVIFFYDLFRGIADDLAAGVNMSLLPGIERSLFGGIIPTVWLQESLGSIANGVLGTILTFFYFGHFILPVATLYLLWRKNLQVFRVGISTIALVSLLGFLTFLLFPAAPPWMASTEGVIPEVDRLIIFHLNRLFSSNTLPLYYLALSPNDVAPFPALHASYPMVLFLLSNKYFPRFKWFFLANVAIVSFTVILFAEHYVVDVVAGWVYALIALVLVINYAPFKKAVVSKFTP